MWAWTPLSGEGARRRGGRFNPIGSVALYLSCDPTTAVLEGSQGFNRRFPPLTIVAYAVDCDDVLDLTAADQCEVLGITSADLSCPWQALAGKGKPVPTWEIANRLRADGSAGILVQSFAVGASGSNVNLVLWQWGDELPHRVTVIDDEHRLPRDDSSWRLPSN